MYFNISIFIYRQKFNTSPTTTNLLVDVGDHFGFPRRQNHQYHQSPSSSFCLPSNHQYHQWRCERMHFDDAGRPPLAAVLRRPIGERFSVRRVDGYWAVLAPDADPF